MLDHPEDLSAIEIRLVISVPAFLFMIQITFKLPQGQIISRKLREINVCQLLEYKHSGGKLEASYGIWLLGTQNKNFEKTCHQNIQNSMHFANMHYRHPVIIYINF